MPKVIWLAQENRTAEQQQAAEWRIAKKNLTGKPPGTQLNPTSGKKKKAYEDPETGEKITLTHHYLVGGDDEIFVKFNGQALGQGICGEVTFGQTEDGRMWAIKESSTKPKNSQEDEIAVDLGKAKNYFKYQGKHYQIYHFLGTPLNKHLKEAKQNLAQAQQYDLAIKMARAVYHLHTGKYSKKNISYAHLDLKPENFCIDDSGELHLIDYGLSEVLPGKLNNEIKGSPAYLPFSVAEASKEALDIIALLRSLYFPRCFKAVQKIHSRPHSSEQNLDTLQWVFSNEVLNQNSALSQLLDTTNGEVVKLSALNITCQLILLKYDLHSDENLHKVTTNAEQFEKSYQCLRSLGLNQAAYIKYVLDQHNSINVFKEHVNKFLILNQYDLNQPIYIEKVLANLEQFSQDYECLESLGLNQATYLKYVFEQRESIDLLKEHASKLLTLNQYGLNQPIYIKKVLTSPEQFNQDHQYLKSFGLNQAAYLKYTLDQHDQFAHHCQRLKDLKLNSRNYIEEIIKHPERFEQNYQHLETLGLNQEIYIRPMLDNPQRFGEYCQQLKDLGLNQASDLARALDHPQRFQKDLPSLSRFMMTYLMKLPQIDFKFAVCLQEG
ncbi:Protein kinase domain protein [Piscirickettsia salmonis]|uniref:protein kinase domain-containing protein n=1 Tax=Piscirickettsia salmonis TaxID=1238 RepID=UPI0012BAD02F|nr:hypothetical protein [Piscirickettsia salmonis]QGP53314.1 Protein kinase domain protein [Piscirickettsia salmonis]QGP60765.1 Protein kinase domain protein [Piscirickettsia salmonis]QGP62879.1 Protein kinase domain protein [Piscirickettsia salmonis]